MKRRNDCKKCVSKKVTTEVRSYDLKRKKLLNQNNREKC